MIREFRFIAGTGSHAPCGETPAFPKHTVVPSGRSRRSPFRPDGFTGCFLDAAQTHPAVGCRYAGAGARSTCACRCEAVARSVRQHLLRRRSIDPSEEPINAASPANQKSAAAASAGIVELVARILLVTVFLISGLGKLPAYSATAQYMTSLGVPGALLPPVIATEVLGAVAIILGWRTRILAFLLVGFTLLTALFFHSHLGDQNQMNHFLKNVAIAGGFLLLVVHGAGPLSLDRRAGR